MIFWNKYGKRFHYVGASTTICDTATPIKNLIRENPVSPMKILCSNKKLNRKNASKLRGNTKPKAVNG